MKYLYQQNNQCHNKDFSNMFYIPSIIIGTQGNRKMTNDGH